MSKELLSLLFFPPPEENSRPPLFLSFRNLGWKYELRMPSRLGNPFSRMDFHDAFFVQTKLHLRSIIYTKKRPRIVPLHPHPSPPGALKSPPPPPLSPVTKYHWRKRKNHLLLPSIEDNAPPSLSPTPVFPYFHRRSEGGGKKTKCFYFLVPRAQKPASEACEISPPPPPTEREKQRDSLPALCSFAAAVSRLRRTKPTLYEPGQ